MNKLFALIRPGRIGTAGGLQLAAHPPRRTIPADPTDALSFALECDREAEHAWDEGRLNAADWLTGLALEARCRATGGRA